MKAILILLLANVATPAVSQPDPKPQSAPPAPASGTCSPEHAAMGHCTLPPPAQPAPPPARSSICAPEHAAMGHCTPSAPSPPPMGTADPHAGHDMGAATGPQPEPGPPPPEALTGPKHAADAYWGKQESQRGRDILRREHGGLPAYKVLIDRAEARVRSGRDGYEFDAQAWYGGDIDKLWLKSEIEGSWGKKPEHIEVQALWSRAIDPWFDLQAGVRLDPQSGPNRTHLVLGVQGLAPYWWEIEGAVFLSNKGEVTARAEAEYDLRITQKLILQPRAEVELSLQDVPELAMGSGLTNAALGARLRYQVSPLFAPYIGVEYERAFGGTRRLLRAEAEDPGGFNLLAGVRFWF
jgi:copper resistance protein B